MEFLGIIEIIFIVSAIIVFILTKVKIPSLVGFLLAGILIGPSMLGIITNTHSIEVIAEIGVVLLLFSIGIEFSLKKLLKIKRVVFGGGLLQVLITTALIFILAYYYFNNLKIAIFIGFLISLSSTAVVLKILADKGDIDTPHGKTMIGILIFQDLFVVVLMLLVPILAGEGITAKDIFFKIFKAGLIIVVVLLGARFLFPYFLHQIVKTKSRELFIITIIVICLGIAILTSYVGLSLALGAFLAGLMISESEYAHQALSDIIPFKESFMGLFFVSVGMLMNLNFIYQNLIFVLFSLFLVIFIKVFSILVVAYFLRLSQRVSIISSIGLAQIGEFSFVLAFAGKSANLIGDDVYQLVLSVTVMTMILSPFMINFAYKISEKTEVFNILKYLYTKSKEYEEIRAVKKNDHVIIIGFGLNGRNLAKILKELNIPYVILEINSVTVAEMKKRGEPIYYGDGTSIEVLKHLGLDRARAVVIAISDAAATRRIVSLIRKENKTVYIIVRTRYVLEVEDLKRLGANEVIPEELETSIEIFSRVLKYYHYPSNIILDIAESLREDSYKALRRVTIPKHSLYDHTSALKELEVESYLVTDKCSLINRSIRELEIRKKTNVTIIAIKRGEQLIVNPDPDFEFMENDIIIFVGRGSDINRAILYFNEVCGVVCKI
ncbi:MAG: monovalent cation:proton antiporter-2 (CPA2) family protein [Proteobacteria bacterium]|nr:monovalent cation:proton antiporter-2 (CPA2) family protein [Pseudomonadota bacterium]